MRPVAGCLLWVAGYKDLSQLAADRRLIVFLEHRGERPKVHDGAYVAPNATLCGDVTVGENACVMFGAVLTAEGGPVDVGANCVVMENAVVRGTRRHPTSIGDNVVVGPRAHLVGCRVGDNAFLATGATVFNGAVIGEGPRCASTGPCT
jgi:gamma-carbonic anhydrase